MKSLHFKDLNQGRRLPFFSLLSVVLVLMTGCVTSQNRALVDLGNHFSYREKSSRKGPIEIYRDTLGRAFNGFYQISYGSTVEKGFYRQGRRVDSQWVYSEGILDERNFFKNGLREGPQEAYFQQRKTRSHYQNGLKEGWEYEWEGNRLIRKVQYKQGIKTGKESFFNPFEQESACIHYKHAPGNPPDQSEWYGTIELEMGYYDRERCPKGDTALPFSIFRYYEPAGNLNIMGYDHPQVKSHEHAYSRRHYLGTVKDAFDGRQSLNLAPKGSPTYYLVEISLGSFDEIAPTETWIVFSGEVCGLAEKTLLGKWIPPQP